MKRRTMLEIGLVAVGVALGAGAILLFRERPPPPAEPPETAVALRPDFVTGEWPVWRGDAGLTGATDSEVPDAVAVVWRYRTDGAVCSSPVVTGGRVIFGSNDDRVHCVDAATGQPVWTYEAADDVEAPPLAIEGRIFVGSSDGVLHAIDAETGAGIWTYRTGDRILGGANSFRPPGGALRVLVGSYDRKLHCVDAETGEAVWTLATEDYVNGSPAVRNDVVVFGGCDGKVHVVDAGSGRERRAVPLGEGVYIPGSVAVDGGVAYAAHVNDGVAAVEIASGEILWEFRGEGGYFSSPALAPGRVFVSGRDRHLRALDRGSGRPVWSHAARDALDSSPVVAGRKVLVGSNDGRVVAVSLESGDLVWEHSFGGPITGSVAVAGGLVFVPCEDGTLTALGPRR